MSYGLLKRILSHAKEQGWLKEGDVILDCFGGVGTTGILGAYEGYQCVLIELEQKFVDLAEQNFKLHDKAWQEFGNPRPVMIQGDSRRLCEIVEKADLIVSSPPFQEAQTGGGIAAAMQGKSDYPISNNLKGSNQGYQNQGQTYGQLGAMKPGNIDCIVSSPPFIQSEGGKNTGIMKPDAPFRKGRSAIPYGFSGQSQVGETPGQLGSMKPGKVDMVLSSPPYAETPISHIKEGSIGDRYAKTGEKGVPQQDIGYGQSPGNLGNLKPGDVDAIISSPPYERSLDAGHPKNKRTDGTTFSYGFETPGQLGAMNLKIGDTFWSAAKTIVQQCHQILKPGGHAIWVVKSFVRKGKIVDFPGDWQRLCESVGFKTVCIHHAMLVKETKHKTLFGDTEIKQIQRKSFFRRLAESKGSPRIDNEVVLCMRK